MPEETNIDQQPEEGSAYLQPPVATPAADEGGEGWISVDDRLPEQDKESGNSDNVFVMCNKQLMIMAYCEIPGEGYSAWCNCYNDIYGDPEYDEEYKPTHWMPLPKLPSGLAIDSTKVK